MGCSGRGRVSLNMLLGLIGAAIRTIIREVILAAEETSNGMSIPSQERLHCAVSSKGCSFGRWSSGRLLGNGV